jgi:hypothetical protein
LLDGSQNLAIVLLIKGVHKWRERERERERVLRSSMLREVPRDCDFILRVERLFGGF